MFFIFVDVLSYPANVQNEPATGAKAAISPSDSMVINTMTPTMAYDNSMEPGPPRESDVPVPRNNPVPIVPVMIYGKLLLQNWRFLRCICMP